MSRTGNPYDQIKEVKGVISVQEMTVELSDLCEGEFVIVSIYDQVSKKDRKFVAKINKVNTKNKIVVDFLKQNYDQKDVFHVSTAQIDIDMHIRLKDIIMILPTPLEAKRGGKYIFDGKIYL